MILRTSPSSPFGRKVKLLAIHVGLMGSIHIEPANTQDPDDSFHTQNPLGKIPVLVLDSRVCIYDSHVICEYLDSLNEGTNIFPEGLERWGALTLAALSDGIIEAALLQVYEKRYRPENMQYKDWVSMQAKKVSNGLEVLEKNIPQIERSPHIGHFGLACALGYLDFRFEGNWQRMHPNLVDWLKLFSDLVPAYSATLPSD